MLNLNKKIGTIVGTPIYYKLVSLLRGLWRVVPKASLWEKVENLKGCKPSLGKCAKGIPLG